MGSRGGNVMQVDDVFLLRVVLLQDLCSVVIQDLLYLLGLDLSFLCLLSYDKTLKKIMM